MKGRLGWTGVVLGAALAAAAVVAWMRSRRFRHAGPVDGVPSEGTAPRPPAAVPEARFEERDRRHRGGAKYD